VRGLQPAGRRHTPVAGAVGGERLQTATVIVDDGNQAASSPDTLSSLDPLQSSMGTNSPP